MVTRKNIEFQARRFAPRGFNYCASSADEIILLNNDKNSNFNSNSSPRSSTGVQLSSNTKYVWHCTIQGPVLTEGQAKPNIRGGGSPECLFKIGPTTEGKAFKLTRLHFSDNSAASGAGVIIQGGCPAAEDGGSAPTICQRGEPDDVLFFAPPPHF